MSLYSSLEFFGGNNMEEIIVKGGKQLNGTVKIEGAKNAVLPILAASLLAEEGTTVLDNVPILSDVFTMNQVIRHLNVDVVFDEDNNQVTLDASRQLEIEAPYEWWVLDAGTGEQHGF